MRTKSCCDDAIWQTIRRTGQLAGRNVHCFETVESTNSLALAMAKEGAASGTVVVAESQTKGRGRLGKSWSSPTGTGLYCTILLRPDLPLAQLSRLTLAAGLATALAIDAVSGLLSMIKWPNDVLLAGRKVAGILAECDLTDEDRPAVAVGVGINLATSLAEFPEEVRQRATSLWLASGREVGKGLMLSTLVATVDRLVDELERGGFTAISGEWKKKDATAAQQLTWLTTNGHTVHGQSLGPDEDGCLLIRDSAGRCHHVMSGDITLDPSTLNGYFP